MDKKPAKREPATAKMKYKSISTEVTDLLQRNFPIIYCGKNGTGVFISSGYVNNFWQKEELDIPFGAPVILFSINGNPNTPILCCMQYEPDILIISRLTGRLRGMQNTDDGCLACIQNPYVTSVKRFLAKKDPKRLLSEKLMGAPAESFHREIRKIVSEEYTEGLTENAVYEQAQEIITVLQEKRCVLLQILSTPWSTEICYSKDVLPGTPVEYVKATYYEETEAVEYEAGFLGKDTLEGDKQMYFREPIVSFASDFDQEEFSNILDTWIISDGNTHWLKEISVDYMIAIIKRIQKKTYDKNGNYTHTGIRVIRSRKKKVLYNIRFDSQIKRNIFSKIISAFKGIRYKRIKAKHCISCSISSENTIDIII